MLFYRKPLHTKALILITLLALPMTVFGEWTEIFESDDGSLFYVDHNLLTKHKSFIYFWSLADLNGTDVDGDKSALLLKKLNCEVPETLLLKLIMYEGHMAEGDSKTHTFSEQEWEIPPTRSPHARAVQWACDYILVENNDEKIL